MKRAAALLLTFLLILTLLPLSVFAAEEPTVAQKAAELETKYGITIQYASKSNGEASISTSMLDTLDRALDNLTPGVVKQVARYYQNKYNRPFTVAFVKSSNMHDDGIVEMAQSTINECRLELYIPTSNGTARHSGESPINIVHEMGHFIHLMFMDSYGADRMRGEWTAFNDGVSYSDSNTAKNPNEKIFVSGYAATDFYEDVAEVIGHAFVRHQAGQGLQSQMTRDGAQTGLGKKVAYTEKMLASLFEGSEAMLNNYRRIYSAPSTLSHQSMKFGGDYLQYIGYAQPRYILNGTLRSIGMEKESAVWLRDLGGWYVQTTGGKKILVFPGGSWAELKDSFTVPGM